MSNIRKFGFSSCVTYFRFGSISVDIPSYMLVQNGQYITIYLYTSRFIYISGYIFLYNPLINFRAILLAILGHVVLNRRAGIGQYTRPCRFLPHDISVARKHDTKLTMWASFQFLSSLIIQNESNKDKLVLYNPISLKFLAENK